VQPAAGIIGKRAAQFLQEYQQLSQMGADSAVIIFYKKILENEFAAMYIVKLKNSIES
jgi:hypothetical protein